LHLSIRVKINMITHGIWPLLTNAKCVILNVTDSFVNVMQFYERQLRKLINAEISELERLRDFRSFSIDSVDHGRWTIQKNWTRPPSGSRYCRGQKLLWVISTIWVSISSNFRVRSSNLTKSKWSLGLN
jgi:hypothetical protein